MKAPWKEEILATQCASHGQGADFDQLIRVDVWRLHIHIHADTSYPSQSHAKIEMWTPHGWAEVARLLAAEINTAGVTRYAGREQVAIPAGFGRDRQRLLDMARMVLTPVLPRELA